MLLSDAAERTLAGQGSTSTRCTLHCGQSWRFSRTAARAAEQTFGNARRRPRPSFELLQRLSRLRRAGVRHQSLDDRSRQ
jgi:hypothetical protein